MKRTGLTALVAVMLGCGMASAQSGQTQSGQSTQGHAQSGKSNMVTVTGCVQSGTQGAVGTTGSTTATGSSTTGVSSGAFMLTNARMATSEAGSTAGSGAGTTDRTTGTTSGNSTSRPGQGTDTTGATGNSGMASSYMLEGPNLNQHVGHQVEVMGTVSMMMPHAGTGATGTGSTGVGTTGTGATGIGGTTTGGTTAGSGSTPAMGMSRLQASSIKMISATCSR